MFGESVVIGFGCSMCYAAYWLFKDATASKNYVPDMNIAPSILMLFGMMIAASGVAALFDKGQDKKTDT
jgi:hypothetical protein